MKAGALILCCLTTFALLRITVFACSCMNLSNEARRDHGDLIFIGTAVSVGEATTLFSIERVLKGQAGNELLIDTPSGTCRIKFAQGATYLVSVKLSASERYTDTCYGNELIRSAEENVTRSPVAQSRSLMYVAILAVVLVLVGVWGWLLLSRHAAA